MSKEAMKLALEALELVNLEFVCANGSHHAKEDRHEWDEDCPITDRWRKAIIALREALAEQPAQQEPVAWMYTSQWKGDEKFITRYQSELMTYKADKVWPLYTSPPAQRTWVGLTAKDWNVIGFTAEFRAGAEWANDKLKEMNT